MAEILHLVVQKYTKYISKKSNLMHVTFGIKNPYGGILNLSDPLAELGQFPWVL